MTKTSTIQFRINSLASQLDEELINPRLTFHFENEFNDVFRYLDKLDLDVDQIVVDKILAIEAE